MTEEESGRKLSWFSAPGEGFGTAPADADDMHIMSVGADPAATETYWFTVNLPKQRMVGSFYLKIRQALGSCASGVWFYRGVHPDPLLVDHMNYHMSIAKPSLVDGIIDVRQVGLTIGIVEPKRRWRLAYNAPDGSASVDLECEARSPLAMTVSGEHFDQAMWCYGTVRLENETIEVNAPGFRDRTWNAPRPEDKLDQPPLSYIYGMMDEGKSSFCLRGGDDPAHGVEWSNMFDLTVEQLFHGGWLFLDDELLIVNRMSKRTRRDFSQKARPLYQEIAFEDSRGRQHMLKGDVVGAMFYQPWGNCGAWMCNTQWSLNGIHVGFGEIQELVWARYARSCWK